MSPEGLAPWADEVHAVLAGGGFRASAVVRGGGWNVAMDLSARVPAASLIKLPVLAALALALHEEDLDPGERLTVPAAALAGGAGVLRHLHADQAWRLDDLAVLMIAVSDNTAANVLLDRLQRWRVDHAAERLGMRATTVAGPLGDEGEGSSQTTAGDVAELLRRVVAVEGMPRPAAQWMREVLAAQQVRTKLAAGLPWDAPAGTLAHKTGELPGVEHDAGIVSAGGGTVVVAVCLTQVDDRAEARRAIGRVGAAVYASLALPAGHRDEEVRLALRSDGGTAPTPASRRTG